jgi:hypothetical protein
MIPSRRNAPQLYRRVLRNAVSDEARAYGFSVVLLSTGYLTISERGLPGVGGTFAFLGGAIVAQWVTGVLAFGKPTATWQTQENMTYYAHVAVHYVSVALAVLVGWGVAAGITTKDAAFGASSFCAILVYELLLALETMLGIADVKGEEQR